MTENTRENKLFKADILENEFKRNYPSVLEILLKDYTTNQNILWATEDYGTYGDDYSFYSTINIEQIISSNEKIMPRVLKNRILQKNRVKNMGEVYTPSWLCNDQINSIDDAWFNRKNVFNKSIVLDNGTRTWETNKSKIKFPKGKTWKDYIKDIRLEIACGEAPYLVSRYDTTTGDFINIENRIGFLDRKIRVLNENIKSESDWLKNIETIYKSIYAYEYHGDSLLLARESLLYTFIENYVHKFNVNPNIDSIKTIASIISWNIWQMDGLTFKTPFKKENNLLKNNLDNNKYNPKDCLIIDWTDKNSKKIKFTDLIR